MKTKKFIFISVTRKNGTTFNNHLKLSEVHLITSILKDNAEISAHIDETTPERFKMIFG